MLPTPDQIWAAADPLTLGGEEYEVTRFVYDRGRGQGAATAEIVFEHRNTGERVCFRFRGVEPVWLPPVTLGPAEELTVVNATLRQWEGPGPLRVASGWMDEGDTVLFWAADAELAPPPPV